jgi:antitoxin (DNA-binding transcriptional repressor) of toxin-antitoxin stability system
MRSVTGTAATDNFRPLLDAVKQGETVLVVEDGETVAEIVPRNGRVVDRIMEALEKYPLSEEAAEEFARAVQEVRDSVVEQEREWPAG